MLPRKGVIRLLISSAKAAICTKGHSRSVNVGTINGFKLAEVWGIVYNAGDGVIRHNHYPYALSFCYYANVPDDSAPFVLEGIQIPPKTGTVIFFLPHLYHWVPPTHSNGRSVITGNISYG